MAKRQSLEQFISQSLNDATSDNEKVSCITLVHMQGGRNDGVELHTVKLGGRTVNPAELAELFQGRADAYAQDLPGAQTFCLYVFYESSKNEIRARRPFVANGIVDYGGLMTEPPDERGMRQQSMRHGETIVMGVLRQVAIVFETDTRRIESLSRENSELRTENREAFLMLKELLIERDKRDHEYRMKELEMQRSSEERKKLLTMAPALLNSITGREIFPQATEDSALVEMILEECIKDPSKVETIMQSGILPPAAMGPVMSRLERYENEKKQNAALARSANGVSANGAG